MAYKLDGLLAKLKVEGKEALEQAALKVIDVVGAWVKEESAKKEHGLVDVFADIIASQALPVLKDYADDLNGKKDLQDETPATPATPVVQARK